MHPFERLAFVKHCLIPAGKYLKLIICLNQEKKTLFFEAHLVSENRRRKERANTIPFEIFKEQSLFKETGSKINFSKFKQSFWMQIEFFKLIN